MHPNGIHVATFGGGVDAQAIDLTNTSDMSLLTTAWDEFADPESLDVNILINGGWTQAAVQLKMDEIAQSRRDCIAVLDVPSDLQDDVNKIMLWRKGQDPYALNQVNSDAIGLTTVTAMFDSSYSAIYTLQLVLFKYLCSFYTIYLELNNISRICFLPASVVTRLNYLGYILNFSIHCFFKSFSSYSNIPIYKLHLLFSSFSLALSIHKY